MRGGAFGRVCFVLALAFSPSGAVSRASGQGQPDARPAFKDSAKPQAGQADKTTGSDKQQSDTQQSPAAKDSKGGKDGDKAAKQAGGQDKGASGGGQSKDTSGGQGGANENLINADRPGIADGSQVIGPRRFQIEAGIETDFLGGGNATQRLLTIPTLLRFGIDTRYELRIESSGYANLSSTTIPGGTLHTDGVNPISIGFKRQFQSSSGARHPGVGAIVRLYPGSGGGTFKTSHATGDARLAADWDFAPHLSLNPNIGAGVYEDDQGRLYGAGLLATTLTYAPTSRLGIFADYGLQTRQMTDSATSLIYDGGVTYIVGTNVQLDVAVGTGALSRATPHPFWTAGVSVRF